MKVRAYWADVEVEWKLEVLLVLGHRSLIKKIRIHLQVPESFVFWVTWNKSLFGVVLFPVFYFFCFTWAYVICAPVPAERSENYTYLVFKNCNGHFWKCMWTSIRNVKFLKNALEYNVYHRCLCNFLNQTMISIRLRFSCLCLDWSSCTRREDSAQEISNFLLWNTRNVSYLDYWASLLACNGVLFVVLLR